MPKPKYAHNQAGTAYIKIFEAAISYRSTKPQMIMDGIVLS